MEASPETRICYQLGNRSTHIQICGLIALASVHSKHAEGWHRQIAKHLIHTEYPTVQFPMLYSNSVIQTAEMA